MYKIVILKTARESLEKIICYLALELKNPVAARELQVKLNEGMKRIAAFPYSCPVLDLPMRLKHEYRKLIVKNYMELYWIDEKNTTVNVEQIMYARRDIAQLTEQE